MASAKNITDGVFAINKPPGISSAQVIRDVQSSFSPSAYFAEYMVKHRQSASKRERRMGLADRVKMGHGGTLDPLATGVLILGVGNGTKQLSSFLSCTKSYETIVLFGAATDTYDKLGKIIGRKPYEHITKAAVEAALSKFHGKIMQQPPIFSALRMDGKRLYDYAREGKELPREIEKRPVEVLEIELTEWVEGGSHDYAFPEAEAEEDTKKLAEEVLKFKTASIADAEQNTPSGKRKHELIEDHSDVNENEEKKPRTETNLNAGVDAIAVEEVPNQKDSDSNSVLHTSSGIKPPAAKIRMTVTSGFYVRSFCHDLGAALGSLALMSELVRTRQGDFELGKNVLEYASLAKGEEVWAPEIQTMLESWNESNQG